MTVLTREELISGLQKGFWTAFELSWPYLLPILVVVIIAKIYLRKMRHKRR